MALNEQDSRAVYAAIYQGLTREWRSGFDVARFSNGTFAPIASGCAHSAGADTMWPNVDISSFGPECRIEDYADEQAFVDDVYGCLGDVDIDV